MPSDRQIRYPTELQYNWSERLSTGGQFVGAEYGMVKIENYLLKANSKIFVISICKIHQIISQNNGNICLLPSHLTLIFNYVKTEQP
jgi:hypothetical protein